MPSKLDGPESVPYWALSRSPSMWEAGKSLVRWYECSRFTRERLNLVSEKLAKSGVEPIYRYTN